jgi:hypothetical protein
MKRAVRTLIRLIAFGMLIFGILEIGLELTRHQMHKTEISILHCIIGGVLIVAGTILFAVSAKLAEQLTDDFEE